MLFFGSSSADWDSESYKAERPPELHSRRIQHRPHTSNFEYEFRSEGDRFGLPCFTLLNNTQPEVFHELEIEFARSDYLLSAAVKRGDPNVSELERGAFDELIRAFVNNARILTRNAGAGDWGSSK